MHRAPLTPSAVARLAGAALGLALPLALAACSSPSGSKAAASTGGSSTAASSVAKAGGSSFTCAKVPASEVNAELGTSVQAPTVHDEAAPVVACYYPSGSNPQEVIVRVQPGMTAASFAAGRQQMDQEGEPTADLAGLGDQAYSSSFSGGGIQTATVVVLKGSTELLVTGPGAVDQVQALAADILPSL